MAEILKDKVTINFGNNTWSTDFIENVFHKYPWAVVGVESEAVFNGENGGLDAYSMMDKNDWDCNNDYGFAVTVKDGKLTINGGRYLGNSTAVYVYNGECVINGGFFFAQPDSSNASKSEAETEKYGPYRTFVINCLDKNYKAGTAKVSITGGTFVNFDPADNYAEGNGTNFVAPGYKSVKCDEGYTYMIKDKNHPRKGQLNTLPMWKVVPENAE